MPRTQAMEQQPQPGRRPWLGRPQRETRMAQRALGRRARPRPKARKGWGPQPAAPSREARPPPPAARTGWRRPGSPVIRGRGIAWPRRPRSACRGGTGRRSARPWRRGIPPRSAGGPSVEERRSKASAARFSTVAPLSPTSSATPPSRKHGAWNLARGRPSAIWARSVSCGRWGSLGCAPSLAGGRAAPAPPPPGGARGRPAAADLAGACTSAEGPSLSRERTLGGGPFHGLPADVPPPLPPRTRLPRPRGGARAGPARGLPRARRRPTPLLSRAPLAAPAPSRQAEAATRSLGGQAAPPGPPPPLPGPPPPALRAAPWPSRRRAEAGWPMGGQRTSRRPSLSPPGAVACAARSVASAPAGGGGGGVAFRGTAAPCTSEGGDDVGAIGGAAARPPIADAAAGAPGPAPISRGERGRRGLLRGGSGRLGRRGRGGGARCEGAADGLVRPREPRPDRHSAQLRCAEREALRGPDDHAAARRDGELELSPTAAKARPCHLPDFLEGARAKPGQHRLFLHETSLVEALRHCAPRLNMPSAFPRASRCAASLRALGQDALVPEEQSCCEEGRRAAAVSRSATSSATARAARPGFIPLPLAPTRSRTKIIFIC